MEQGTKDWIEMRRTHIGASDISVIMGISPFKTRYQLWLEKTGKKQPDEPTPPMIRGKMMEPVAREWYIQTTGNVVMPNVLVSKEWEIAMASLDGITQDGKLICEIKVPTNPKLYENALDQLIPDYYNTQMQWALWVSKAEICDYFVYMDEEDHTWIKVFPDPEYQKELVKEAKLFWKLVTNETPPEMTETDNKRIQKEQVQVVESRLMNEMAKELEGLMPKLKELEDRITFLKTQIKEFCEDKNSVFTDSLLKLSFYTSQGTVDWKKVQNDFGITEEVLETYRKKPIMNSKFSIFNK